MKRVLLPLGGFLLALLILFAGGVIWLVTRNLPDEAAPQIRGLKEPVRVTFDAFGVATVAARSVDDAIRVQGYLTARDRLFQLELQRDAAEGRLSEHFGKAALDLDRRRLTFGYARVAGGALPRLPDVERGHLVALCDGINAFIGSHTGRWGLEYTLLRQRPRAFSPENALLVLLLMYEDLTTVFRTEIARDANRRLAPGLFEFVFSNLTAADVTLVPDREPVTPPAVPSLAVAGAGRPGGTGASGDREAAGSNAWAVSGSRTKSGRPILANDPHLALAMPSIWLPMRFEIGGRHVEGVTLPGLPGVIIGKNESLAWGMTNLYADVQDLYRETIQEGWAARRGGSEAVEVRVETIPIRGAPPERLEVRTTSHGPLVTKDLALKWVALDPGSLRLPEVELMLAATPDELNRALDDFLGPSQNVVWASATGDIGWRAAGRVPIRRPGTDGSVPYDGSDPENDWRGFLPPSEMPRVMNPTSGYVVTANQRVIGTSFPHPVSTHFWSSVRARRIADLIEAAGREGRKLDRATMEAFQLDVVSEPMRKLAGAFAPYLPADLQKLFAGWDGGADAATPRFLIARSLRDRLGERTLRIWRVRGEGVRLAEERILDVALADKAAWRRAGLGDKGAAMRLVVEEALREIAGKEGLDRSRWSWGTANPLTARHPLGRLPGLSRFFDAPRVPMPGASGVPRVQTPLFGQSMRFVVDWGEPEAATLVVPFGVSGHVGSPHRMDQFPFWKEGDPSGTATRIERPPVGKALVFTP